MTKKRRKKRISEEEIISLPPETEIEEVVGEEIVEEEVITEERIITGVEPPLTESIESPPPPTTKRIRYLGVDIFITKGPITGQRYRFTAKDRISEVAIEDYEGLLNKVSRSHRCCGRKAGDPSRMTSSQPYFGPV